LAAVAVVVAKVAVLALGMVLLVEAVELLLLLYLD
jgi:hypothetical protein